MNSQFEEQLRIAVQKQAGQSEPLPGHEERFETRLMLKDRDRKVRRIPRWPVIALAAASVCVLIVSMVMRQMNKDQAELAQARLSDVSYEMAQVEQFYSERIRLEMPQGMPEDQVIGRFRSELQRLETEYRTLEKVLATNFSNEKVIASMVENYRYRLQIIEMMQRYIEMRNNIKTDNHEKGISS